MDSHNQSGFTLLELLYVLAILLITASFSTPLFSFIENRNAIHSRDKIITIINTARGLALSHAKPVTICPIESNNECGSDWTNGFLIFIDFDNRGQVDNTDEILMTFSALPADHSLVWSSFGSNNYLRFTELGSTDNQNGSFIYCTSSRQPELAQTIIINRSGRARAGKDKNKDGIIERANGNNLSCET